MVWWLIPVIATVVAVAWVTWVNRPRPPADTHDSLREHERFKQAMERTDPLRPSAPAPGDDDPAEPDPRP